MLATPPLAANFFRSGLAKQYIKKYIVIILNV
jgi:hypothetical protein